MSQLLICQACLSNPLFFHAANSAAGKIGGKAQNRSQHKQGEWYQAHCDNPQCIEKTADWIAELAALCRSCNSEKSSPLSCRKFVP
jgi:hypothetical protein